MIVRLMRVAFARNIVLEERLAEERRPPSPSCNGFART